MIGFFSNRTGLSLKAALIGMATALGVGLVLIPRFGIWGAAIGAFIAATMFAGVLWNDSSRVSSIRFDVSRNAILWLLYVLANAANLTIVMSTDELATSLILRSLLLVLTLVLVFRLVVDEEDRATVFQAMGKIVHGER